MHEASVTEQLIKTATLSAKENNAIKVLSIRLVVGEATGYMEESLQFYFDTMSRDTILEGAKLSVETIKPKLKCESCGIEYERKLFTFDCPKCGKPGVMTKIGMEFFIEDIEIETTEG